jgi:hypothetical protein
MTILWLVNNVTKNPNNKLTNEPKSGFQRQWSMNSLHIIHLAGHQFEPGSNSPHFMYAEATVICRFLCQEPIWWSFTVLLCLGRRRGSDGPACSYETWTARTAALLTPSHRRTSRTCRPRHTTAAMNSATAPWPWSRPRASPRACWANRSSWAGTCVFTWASRWIDDEARRRWLETVLVCFRSRWDLIFQASFSRTNRGKPPSSAGASQRRPSRGILHSPPMATSGLRVCTSHRLRLPAQVKLQLISKSWLPISSLAGLQPAPEWPQHISTWWRSWAAIATAQPHNYLLHLGAAVRHQDEGGGRRVGVPGGSQDWRSALFSREISGRGLDTGPVSFGFAFACVPVGSGGPAQCAPIPWGRGPWLGFVFFI